MSSTNRPRALDLFSGAGGAAMGYHRAGYEVVCVDIEPHPDNPFEFHQADAFTVLADLDYCRSFDIRHASPPCQHYSTQTGSARDNHPDLIGPTRKALLAVGGPYVIENVEGARRHLDHPIKLCGSSFGLGVWRHRYFEINPKLWMLQPPCQHTERPWTVTGDHGDSRDYVRPKTGTLRARKPRNLEHAQEVMGIDWMDWKDLCEAIPPAYTEYIGEQLLAIMTYIEQEQPA